MKSSNQRRMLHLMFPAMIAAVMSIFSLDAAAQATRTWVSGVGDDVNPCSRTAPCKTFAGAISKTADGGEINALDPGGYGALTITKSITINGAGTLASDLASGTTGFIINTPVTETVTIRYVSISGASVTTPSGISGIRVIAGGKVNIENCDIRDFTVSGINISTATNVSMTVKDTVIYNTVNGIKIDTAATGNTVSLDNVRMQGGTTGLNIDANAIVTVSNSVISHNTTAGISTLGSSQVNAESVQIANNGTGILAAGTSIVRMSNLGIFNNTTGIARTGTTSVLASFSNNKFGGNGTPGAPTAYLASQ